MLDGSSSSDVLVVRVSRMDLFVDPREQIYRIVPYIWLIAAGVVGLVVKETR